MCLAWRRAGDNGHGQAVPLGSMPGVPLGSMPGGAVGLHARWCCWVPCQAVLLSSMPGVPLGSMAADITTQAVEHSLGAPGTAAGSVGSQCASRQR